MLPDIDSLSLFLRAVKLRSLSKAADACNLSLSAASRRLTLLEHQVGATLFDRLHTGVSPTAAGEAIALHAEIILGGMDAMLADVSDYARGAVGRVRLCANVSALSQDLPQSLATWSAAHPTVKISVREMRSRDILNAIRQGAADVGVVTTAPTEDLRFELYGPDPLCVIVHAEHRMRVRAVSFAELLGEEFVALDDAAASTAAMRRAATEAGRYLRVRVQMQSFEAVCRLVAAGQGIGVTPLGTAQAFRSAMKLRIIRLREPWAQRKMYLCMPKGKVAPATLRFAEFLLTRASAAS